MGDINRKAIAELLISARTGRGLAERTNDDGHCIRDAWLHEMIAKKLPNQIDLLLAALDRAEADKAAAVEACATHLEWMAKTILMLPEHADALNQAAQHLRRAVPAPTPMTATQAARVPEVATANDALLALELYKERQTEDGGSGTWVAGWDAGFDEAIMVVAALGEKP
jgi:hypothetical protein